MVFPSLLQVGLNAPPDSAVSSTGAPPEAGIVKICDVPDRVELNASVPPSGLQAGAPSGTAVLEPVERGVGASKTVASKAGAGTDQSRGVPLRLLTKDNGRAVGAERRMGIVRAT